MGDWEEVPVNVMLDSVFPYILSYHIVSKGSTPSDVSNEHLSALGSRWKITPMSKNKASSMTTNSQTEIDLNLLQALYTHSEVLDNRRGGRRVANSSMLSTDKQNTLQALDNTYDSFLPPAKPTRKFKELERNYFGLPIYALNRTPEGIVYQARKPCDALLSRFTDLGPRQDEEEEEEEKSLVEQIEVKATNHRYLQLHILVFGALFFSGALSLSNSLSLSLFLRLFLRLSFCLSLL
jgi:hypothetical protein